MRSRNVMWTLVFILALLFWAVFKRWQEPRQKEPFDRSAPLAFTAFALCQMQCKNISKETLEEVKQIGLIHFNKSNRRRWPCPTYTLQARTQNKRYLRVVFEQCNTKTNVLFADDLEKGDSCFCSQDR